MANNSAHIDQQNIPTVLRLHKIVSPPAIFWPVITIDIYPVESASVWSLAHISKKSLKTVCPLLTDSDPSATVHRVIAVTRIERPVFHAFP